MARWQPIASMVTTAPSIFSMPRSLGMATISLDFSATLTWPRTRRWRAAKADTMWIGPLGSFFFLEVFEPDRRTVLPSMATTSAGTPVCAATHATKQRSKASVSSVARMSPSSLSDSAFHQLGFQAPYNVPIACNWGDLAIELLPTCWTANGTLFIPIYRATGAPRPLSGRGEDEHSLQVPRHGHQAPLAAHFLQPAQ